MIVVAKVTHTFNNFGNGGIPYMKGITYEADCLNNGYYTVKHPCGGELAFHNSDFHYYFKIVRN